MRAPCVTKAAISENCTSPITFDDQIRTADIEIVAATASEVLKLPTRSVLTEIKLESHSFKSIEQVLVESLRFFGEEYVALLCQGQRDRRRDQVAVIQ
jgi:hypothetical protein